MNIRFIAFLAAPALASFAPGQTPAPVAPAPAPVAPAPVGPLRAKALLIDAEGAFVTVWLTAATKSAIRYYETEVAVETVDKRISDFAAIFVYEPKEFTEALNLYQSRKYQEAMARFVTVKERYRPLVAMENSTAAQAGFYEMECLRRLGDLEGLAAANGKFIKDPITRETMLSQIRLYVLWDAVRTKSWDRLLILTNELEKTKLPMDQRAQVGYCQGLACEGLKKLDDAMFGYQIAITADAGNSEELARQAALKTLTILQQNEEVKTAMRVWGTQDERRGSRGYELLSEAHGLAKLFDMSLGAGATLPPSLRVFLKYAPKDEPISQGSDEAEESGDKGSEAPPAPGAPKAPAGGTEEGE